MTFSKPSPRIEKIKDRLRAIKPRLCSERAGLVTQSYRKTDGELAVARRAKALDRVLRGMTIYIEDDELIVGNLASSPMAAPLFPEVAVAWIEQDMDTFETRPQDRFVVPDYVKEELAEILPYWRGKTTRHKLYRRLPGNIKSAIEAGVIRFKNASGIGHQLLDFPKVLRVGFEGIRQEAGEKLAQVDLTEPGALEKWSFWRAIITSCDAVVAFSRRYAEEARRLASTESGQRREELERIAEICERVPAKPARTLHEALQVVWFLVAIAHICQNGTGITIGRLDQFAYPYYARDVEKGRLSKGQAQELLDCLWLKLQELTIARSTEASPIWPGFEMNTAINIGGQTKAGEDAANEVTHMCLDAEAHVHMRRPQLILRVHEGTPEDLWRRAVEAMKLGGGRPALVSDSTMTQALMRLGVPASEVLDYAIIGCAEPIVMGSRILIVWSWVCLPKILELALNDGVDPRTGRQIGPSTGDPLAFTTYDDVERAYGEQLEYFCSLCAVAVNGVTDPLVAEEIPHVFFSSITPDCIEKGLDVTAGGARYDWSAVWPIGPATVGNSLSAIKKAVFEDGKITMAELKRALDKDFQGDEELRQVLIHAPKYGSDDDYADPITRHVVEMFYDELEPYRTARGGRFTAGYISVGINVAYGALVGATPDGRRSGTPLSDGMSPSQGTEMRGPTSSLSSVAKLDLARAGSGGILNQKFNPSVLEKEADVTKFIQLNQTFLNDLGGMQVQYNVVSAKTLRDAQRHPESYPDLLVRVVGYSAYFTELSKQVQDDIILRTEHAAL